MFARIVKEFFRASGRMLGSVLRLLPRNVQLSTAREARRLIYALPPRVQFLAYEFSDELIRCFLAHEEEPVLIEKKVGDGVLDLDIRCKTQRQIYLEKAYEGNVLKYILQNLKSRMTFVDVGANIGYYAVLTGLIVGEDGCVLAFEPEEMNRTWLAANLKRNKLKNVRVFAEALSDTAGKTLLYLNEKNEGGHSLLRERGTVTQSISTAVFDELFRDMVSPCTHIDLIKIDVEGFELHVLLGMKETLQSQKPAIVCEVSAHHKEIFQFMKNIGFRAYVLDAFGKAHMCQDLAPRGARNYLFKSV